jgi:hypothetical protein
MSDHSTTADGAIAPKPSDHELFVYIHGALRFIAKELNVRIEAVEEVAFRHSARMRRCMRQYKAAVASGVSHATVIASLKLKDDEEKMLVGSMLAEGWPTTPAPPAQSESSSTLVKKDRPAPQVNVELPNVSITELAVRLGGGPPLPTSLTRLAAAPTLNGQASSRTFRGWRRKFQEAARQQGLPLPDDKERWLPIGEAIKISGRSDMDLRTYVNAGLVSLRRGTGRGGREWLLAESEMRLLREVPKTDEAAP